MEMMSVVLMAVAFCAGMVDAIAGGGGLLTLPALLAAGFSEPIALGTNKGQSVFGSAAALFGYARRRLIDPKRAQVAFPFGFVGGLFGGLLLLSVDPKALKPMVLVLLIGAAAFMVFRPNPKPSSVPSSPRLLVSLIALGIGFYDGFFGPGTGTFLIVAFVALMGDNLISATAEAKVVNFASNLASVILFGLKGTIVWKVALPMAVAQFFGGWVGAHFAATKGGGLIRKVVLAVVSALVLRLGFDLWRQS